MPSNDLTSAISGGKLGDKASEGLIGNAVGKLHDGWSHVGGQAGVQLNLGHKRAQDKYGYDQQLRNQIGQIVQPIEGVSHATRKLAGTTGPRKIRSRTGAGRKIEVGATIG